MIKFVRIRLGRHYFTVELVGKEFPPGHLRHDVLAGYEVDKTGERKAKETATTITEHLIIFKRKDIVRELRMNLHYGELERVS